MTLSKYDHQSTRIATDNGEFQNCQKKTNCALLTQNLLLLLEVKALSTKKTELLDVKENNWSDGDDYHLDWGSTYFASFSVFQSIPDISQRTYFSSPNYSPRRLVLYVWWSFWCHCFREHDWSTRYKNAQMDQCRKSRDWSKYAQCNLRRAVCARCWRRQQKENWEVLSFKRSNDLFKTIAGTEPLL